MKKFLWMVLLIPAVTYSQSQRKKRKAEERANAEMIASLKGYTRQLTEWPLNMQYLVQQYQQIGLEPKGVHGYLQEFDVSEGKQIDPATQLKIDGQLLDMQTDYTPLAFSASKQIKGEAAMALNENRQPWFRDLKELLEDQKDNAQFNLEAEIRKMADIAFKKGASAYFVYNSSSIPDNLSFNKRGTTATAKIPVIYITAQGLKNHFPDRSATLSIELKTGFTPRTYHVKNLLGFINHHATTTILLSAALGQQDDAGADAAVLMEIARQLKKNATPRYNYLVVHSLNRDHVNGEKEPLYGHLNLPVAPNYIIRLTKTPVSSGPINYEAEKDRVKQVYDLILSTDTQGKLPSTQMEF